MSERSGWQRLLREDLPHAIAGAVLSAGNAWFGLVPIPLDCAISAALGYGRERLQMLLGHDPGYGHSRARDALGFVGGSLAADLLILLLT
jgi:hypothetical protein